LNYLSVRRKAAWTGYSWFQQTTSRVVTLHWIMSQRFVRILQNRPPMVYMYHSNTGSLSLWYCLYCTKPKHTFHVTRPNTWKLLTP